MYTYIIFKPIYHQCYWISTNIWFIPRFSWLAEGLGGSRGSLILIYCVYYTDISTDIHTSISTLKYHPYQNTVYTKSTFLLTCCVYQDTLYGQKCMGTWPSNLYKHIPKPCTLIWSWPFFVAIMASTLPRRLSTSLWSVFVGICARSVKRTLERSVNDVGLEGLVCNWHFNVSQKCSFVLWSGICAGHLSSSISNSSNHGLMDLTLRKGPDKGLHQTAATKLEAYNFLKYLCML